MRALKADSITVAGLRKITRNALDVYSPASVEVTRIGDKLWVNVNGVCLLRISDAGSITVTHQYGREKQNG